MAEQLTKIFGDIATTQNSVTAAVKVEPIFQVKNKEQAFYGNYAKSQTRGHWNSRNTVGIHTGVLFVEGAITVMKVELLLDVKIP